MGEIFELWDAETAHLINTYPDVPSALAVVRATVREAGGEAVGLWLLTRAMPDGTLLARVAEGPSLARMAQATVPAAR